MCGISGFATDPNYDSYAILNKMLHVQRHRGPDDSGSYNDSEIFLGSNLLSIVDVGRGHQPFKREWKGEQYICVYNGEVYNFREVRSELMSLGMVFETDNDTEVVLSAYAAWGESALDKFEGQWAFSVWEVNRKRLFLSRDPLGIKPLYYYENGDFLAFASEPKTLFVHPRVLKAPNVDAILEYFLYGFAFAAGYCSNSRSFYRNVFSLPPGHYGFWEKGHPLRYKRYFHFDSVENKSFRDRRDARQTVRKNVADSVRITLMGDVKSSIALSGGLDSSIITMLAGREWTRTNNAPLLSCSITYEGQKSNEDAHYAALLAKELGEKAIRLEYTRIRPDNYLHDLDKMIYYFDEPHWEVKQLAMFRNYETLKACGAKTVLTGEGADELFFGYYHKFPGFLNPEINSSQVLRSVWEKRLCIVEGLINFQSSERLDTLLSESIDNFYKPYENPGIPPFRRMQYWYIQTFLHWLLLDNDRCSMAFSLEGRFPFLNTRVIRSALGLPLEWQVGPSYGQEKLILREAFRDILPETIRTRKKAPLPSPTNTAYHKIIANSLELALHEQVGGVWDVISKKRVTEILKDFQCKLKSSDGYMKEPNGSLLTSYLHLDKPWQLRTPQIFGILTLLRWWRMNFT